VKFPYLRYSATVVRPVIPVTIKLGRRSAQYDILIDSGADMNILDSEVAKDLGIKLESGTLATVMGATGEAETVYVHQVTFTVGSESFRTRAAFLARPQSYGLAGQRGFFDHFKVTFNLAAEEVELLPVSLQKLS
jgi:Aspartyl protease